MVQNIANGVRLGSLRPSQSSLNNDSKSKIQLDDSNYDNIELDRKFSNNNIKE